MKHKGLIILDGPDASGKTTLADSIVRMYDGMSIHLTYNAEVAPRMYDYQKEALEEALIEAKDKIVVIDRHWMSEAIYANVFRGGSPWPQMGKEFDETIVKNAGFYVICVPRSMKYAVMMHKKNIDQDHPYDDTKYRELVLRYQRLIFGCTCGHFKEDDYASQWTRQGGMGRLRDDVMWYHLDLHGAYLSMICMQIVQRLEKLRSEVLKEETHE